MIRGDHVLVSGFRLEGPTPGIGRGTRREKGIVVAPPATDTDGSPLPPIQSIEICNMEIFHWSGLGIQVVDDVPARQNPRDHRSPKGRLLNTNPAAVRVTGSYIHHNRHYAGFGYGVSSAKGAYVTIEQNVFDENRHAIAGGGPWQGFEDHGGYTVRDNLILTGGGRHCIETTAKQAGWGALGGALLGGLAGWLVCGPPCAAVGAAGGAALGGGGVLVAEHLICWPTHQIDFHGDKNSWYSGHNWQVGTAGETLIIERNTILYTKGNAIKIRGNPLDKAVVDGNVFMHDTVDAAISQNGEPGENPTNPIIVLDTNVFEASDPRAELDHGDFADDIDCGDLTTEPDRRDFADDIDLGDITPEVSTGDFAGDPPGPKDDFMATGVTWWARSRATGQWRYLNTMEERLPELQVGKFDDDDISDVAPRTRRPEAPPERYSKSGTSPWRWLIHPIHP